MRKERKGEKLNCSKYPILSFIPIMYFTNLPIKSPKLSGHYTNFSIGGVGMVSRSFSMSASLDIPSAWA